MYRVRISIITKQTLIMSQQQVENQCGFVEAVIRIDSTASIRIHKQYEHEMEFNVYGQKLTLSKKQWDQLLLLTNNIHLAFTLLGSATIGLVDQKEPEKKKRRREVEPLDKTFDDLVKTLNL